MLMFLNGETWVDCFAMVSFTTDHMGLFVCVCDEAFTFNVEKKKWKWIKNKSVLSEGLWKIHATQGLAWL